MKYQINRHDEMLACLNRQKAAQIAEGIPSEDIREDRLNRAIAMLVENRNALKEALRSDFGHRSLDQTDGTDIMPAITSLKHTRKHFRKWMKPQKAPIDAIFRVFGGRGEVHPSPKGTVGIISPWNFPLTLAIMPMANALGAGNRVMIKPSEFTPATSELLAEVVSKNFDNQELAVFTGGPEVGQAFTALPLDHLIFTGGTSVARHVMRAAADNLVPVTLELGGKSPVILGRSADLQKTVDRIAYGKTLNAGQICLAPDYVLCPKEDLSSFKDALKNSVTSLFPKLKDNDDYTSIINQRHYSRLQSYITDASEKGAEVLEINPANENFSQQPHFKIPPTLILNPTDDMKVMQDEIFGPLLPIKTYENISEAVDYINKNPHPLGLYYFGTDKVEADMVINSTRSGGVTVNDVFFHVVFEDLPFGGIGPSGMGYYHGEAGFREFSHSRTVYRQMKTDAILQILRPPYGDKYRKEMNRRIRN